MIKKIALMGVGLALIASPLVVSAQTTSASSNASMIASLTALVQQLEQELQQLIAARASAPTTQQATPASSTSFANLCAAYAHLTKGNTDATTGGQVSQLQSFLGISPTTGYYGALTAIGYTNKCVGGNAQPTSVTGMSMYADTDFSFWYPSSWTVKQIKTGGDIVESLAIYDSSNNQVMYIDELNYSNGIDSNWIDNYDSEAYYFDSNSATWMYSRTSGSKTNSQPADTSVNTMGGLHMFSWQSIPSTYGQLIPLSATKFVFVNDSSYKNKVISLAQTIVATNPAVAIPVSTAQQTVTIQAEASAYGVSSAPTTSTNTSTSLQTYTNSQYGFSLQYPSILAPVTTLSSMITSSYFGPTVVTGFTPLVQFQMNGKGTGSNSDYFINGVLQVSVSSTPSLVSSCLTTYPDMGDASVGQTTTVSMGGISFTEVAGGDAGTGNRLGFESFSAVHDGMCYKIEVVAQGDYIDLDPSVTQQTALSDASQRGLPFNAYDMYAEFNTAAQSFRFTQ